MPEKQPLTHKKQGAETAPSLLPDLAFALKCRCPVCRKGKLFSSFLTVTKTCPECGAKLGDHDIGDGAAVFLIFLLGASLIPLAWLIDIKFTPPVWVHLLYVGALGGAVMFFLMPAVKAYILLLEYRHRPPQKPDRKTDRK